MNHLEPGIVEGVGMILSNQEFNRPKTKNYTRVEELTSGECGGCVYFALIIDNHRRFTCAGIPKTNRFSFRVTEYYTVQGFMFVRCLSIQSIIRRFVTTSVPDNNKLVFCMLIIENIVRTI